MQMGLYNPYNFILGRMRVFTEAQRKANAERAKRHRAKMKDQECRLKREAERQKVYTIYNRLKFNDGLENLYTFYLTMILLHFTLHACYFSGWKLVSRQRYSTCDLVV